MDEQVYRSIGDLYYQADCEEVRADESLKRLKKKIRRCRIIRDDYFAFKRHVNRLVVENKQPRLVDHQDTDGEGTDVTKGEEVDEGWRCLKDV